jgi:membrane protein YdbS with pleckstrin-like domain
MHEFLKSLVVQLLKVPSEPHVPSGSPGSIRVFRAAPNFYKLKLLQWSVRQAAAVIGFAFFITLWHISISKTVPADVRIWIELAEIAGIVAFLVQMPFTFALVRLDFEMRWYIVTDRSLRIRAGIWQVSEITMSFANIQQITVHQGPLQRLLGIYDLEVSSAGGGSSGLSHAAHGAGSGHDTHRGFFHGIDNAPEIRDMMLDRLRRLRDAGLGDPDELHEAVAEVSVPAESPLLTAARELLGEARALKQALT